VTISLGVDMDFSKEPSLSFLLFNDTMTVGNVVIDGFPLRFFNYSGKFAPPGKTVVQVLLLTDWKYWNDLREDRERYEAAKRPSPPRCSRGWRSIIPASARRWNSRTSPRRTRRGATR